MVRENYFISINLPENVCEVINSKLDRDRLGRIFRGKFVDPSDYHLTLKFFGKLNSEKVEEVKRKLNDIDFGKFDLHVGKLGFFENKFRGILYVELLSEELGRFVKEIWGKVGWERKKFKSHVTLVRTKKIFDIFALNSFMKSFRFGNLSFCLDKFYLMKSELLPEGAKYSIVEEYKFK